ncbi:hypothetical protein Asp14428_08350 [Actinoplanes sp. NBRC 14428]|nr:hypothetical protein Asp14428_08350 [Actinoplanes sp. NBRC 14428]
MSDEPTLRLPAVPEPPDGHRRAWRIAGLAALLTLVLLLPIGMYLVLRGGGEPPAAPAGSPPSPPAAPTSPPPSSAPAPAPDGRIPLTTLANSTLTVPPWPADNLRGPSGRVRFHDGVFAVPPAGTGREPPSCGRLVILSVAYGDVDRDGAGETVAGIGCLIEGGSKQIVAFDRNTAGRIVTMGPVVATTGEIRDIRDGSASVGDDGVVTVRLGDYQVCCDDRTPQAWQTRGYGWHDGRFVQVSGAARMPANRYVTETSVSTGDLVLGPAVAGYRYGTLTVTVRHGWGTLPQRVVVEFHPSAGLERAGTAWPSPGPATGPGFTVTVDPPPAHGAVTRTFAFRRPAAITGGSLDLEVAGSTAAVARLGEATVWNNSVTASIRTVD